MKVAGFGVLRLSKVSEDKFKLERPEAIDRTSKTCTQNTCVASYISGVPLYSLKIRYDIIIGHMLEESG